MKHYLLLLIALAIVAFGCLVVGVLVLFDAGWAMIAAGALLAAVVFLLRDGLPR